ILNFYACDVKPQNTVQVDVFLQEVVVEVTIDFPHGCLNVSFFLAEEEHKLRGDTHIVFDHELSDCAEGKTFDLGPKTQQTADACLCGCRERNHRCEQCCK